MVAVELGYIPDEIAKKPELDNDLGFIMRDFRMLSHSRAMGASCANPISINDIISLHNNVDTGFELQDYIRLIQAADSELLKQGDQK